MRSVLFIILSFSIAYVVKGQGAPCNGPGSSPSSANAVCGNITFNQPVVKNCSGNGNLPNTSAGCGDIVTTDNSIWYKFHCFQSGKMGFLLNPLLATDDFDWEVLDITGHDPNDVYNLDLRVSLNLSGQTGKTGCTTGGTLDVHCGGGGAGTQFNQLMNLQAGHDYVLMVNNWSSSNQGYDIDFSGTAVLTDNALPEITNVTTLGCDASKIKVTFSEDIKCTSITTPGSEFTITGGANTITGTVSDCGIGASSVPYLIITLQSPLLPGAYNLVVDKGTDGDVFRNVCLLEMLPTSKSFTVAPQIPLDVSNIAFTGCAPRYLDVSFSKLFDCNSVTATGSEFSITPGNPVISSVSYNCVNGRADILRINLQDPLPHGNYQLNINAGSDANTIRDTCGVDMAAGYNKAFVVTQTTTPPVIQSLIFDECHPDKVVLNFDKPVLCSSLANDGSDFTITPGAYAVTGMSTDCGANSYAKQVTLTLQNPLPAGNFNANIITGSDANTVGDTCYAFITGAYSKAFVTTKAPAPKFDSLQFEKCTPSTIKVFYNRPIKCSSISADGSDFNITGASPVTITGATTDVTCAQGYSNWVLLQLSQPISQFGNYVVHNSIGTDGDGIVDTCTAAQNIAETISFSVLGQPSAVFNTQVIWACKYDTIVFSHPGGNGINSWQWVFSDGQTASGQIVRHTFPITETSVSAELTVSNGYCSATDKKDILLGNTFTPAFTFASNDTLCINMPFEFTDASMGSGLTYLWQFGDNTQFNGQNPPPHPYTNPGNYLVRLIETDAHGCMDTASAVLTTTAKGTIDFTGLKPQYCTGNDLILTKVASPNIDFYSWDNGNGKTYDNYRYIQFNYPNENLYTITLTANDKYCGAVSISKTVPVYAIPKFNLGRDTVLCPDVHLQLGMSNNPAYSYSWNTGAITSQITTDIFTRKYILTANNHGCRSSDTIAIKLLPSCLIAVPNAFTPNGDGKNDKLMAGNADLSKEFMLSVYNRNGQLLFSTTDPLQGWDGTYKGNKMENGTYVWVLNYINPWTNKPISEKGTAILIR